MKGVFLDLASVDRQDLDTAHLRAALDEWQMYEATSPADAAARIGDAEVVVSNKVLLDSALLARAPRLRLVCVAATGTNNVDLAAARANGITVCNVRAYATSSVVQHVFALLLSLKRRLPEYAAAVRAGRWHTSAQFCLLDFPVDDLADQTLGIVGYGELGRAVAEVARGFGMQVLIAQRPGSAEAVSGRVAIDDLLGQVDVLSLHCPLTAATRGLLDARALQRMKPGAVLINTARGGIVDEAALADALRAGTLGGAGIDVLAEEPPRHGSPLLDADIPNLIVTPHVAWASRAARQRLLDQVADNIAGFRAGTARNVVE